MMLLPPGWRPKGGPAIIPEKAEDVITQYDGCGNYIVKKRLIKSGRMYIKLKPERTDPVVATINRSNVMLIPLLGYIQAGAKMMLCAYDYFFTYSTEASHYLLATEKTVFKVNGAILRERIKTYDTSECKNPADVTRIVYLPVEELVYLHAMAAEDAYENDAII